jgi:NADH dehydrogenase
MTGSPRPGEADAADDRRRHMSGGSEQAHVVIVGGGFAGVACAKKLAGDARVRVTLLERNGYHQFQPLLYQVATAELTGKDIIFDLGDMFAKDSNVETRAVEVISADPAAPAVTLANGDTLTADKLVLAAGASANFFHTNGAAEHTFPLYSVDDARRIRARVIEMFQEAAANPDLVSEGALTFVVVGGGPTGVETAGALAELVYNVMPHRYPQVAVASARVILVDLGHALLSAFSDQAHSYAAKQLQRRGVHLQLGVSVTEVTRVTSRSATDRRSRHALSSGAAA